LNTPFSQDISILQQHPSFVAQIVQLLQEFLFRLENRLLRVSFKFKGGSLGVQSCNIYIELFKFWDTSSFALASVTSIFSSFLDLTFDAP